MHHLLLFIIPFLTFCSEETSLSTSHRKLSAEDREEFKLTPEIIAAWEKHQKNPTKSYYDPQTTTPSHTLSCSSLPEKSKKDNNAIARALQQKRKNEKIKQQKLGLLPRVMDKIEEESENDLNPPQLNDLNPTQLIEVDTPEKVEVVTATTCCWWPWFKEVKKT